MAKGKRRENTFIRVFCGAFISVGVILLIAGIGISVSDHSFRQKAEPVEAVILAMRGATSESLGTPVVEYSVDGKTYTSTLNIATSSMHPGNRITVYCQKGNPQEVRYLDSSNWLVLIFAFVGFVFVGSGAAVWMVKRRHKRKVCRLLARSRRSCSACTSMRKSG